MNEIQITPEVSLSDYTSQGGRFRLTDEQKIRFDAGAITREEAFEEYKTFKLNGGVRPTVEIPASVWSDPDLSLDNFSDKVLVLTGQTRRFRIPREDRIAGLTREESFVKFVAQMRASNVNSTTPTIASFGNESH